MKELTTKDMTEYLKNVMLQESSVYRQNEIVHDAQSMLEENRPFEKHIEKPKKKKIKGPESYNVSELKQSIKDAEAGAEKNGSFKIFGLIAGILATALGFKLLTVEDVEFFGGFIFFCGIAMLVSARSCRKEAEYYRKQAEEYTNKVEQKKLEYNRQLEEYKQQVADNENKYKKDLDAYEISVKRAGGRYRKAMERYKSVEHEVGQLDKHLSETQQILKKLYDLDYIFPKYRNFAAICSIYEYFVSGRCTELTGADGAYNLYESELRQNLIIERLDKIIDSLEVIKENQYALYSELERTNEILNGISSDMRELVSTVRRIEITANRIEDAVHITNYYTQVTAQNTKALKYIALING